MVIQLEKRNGRMWPAVVELLEMVGVTFAWLHSMNE
jgi:hypothetical protein